MKDKRFTKKGSVLIIVLIMSSILFTIGITFAFILEKEVKGQTYAERSQKALNIANSALECFLYNDFQRNIFATRFFSTNPHFDCGNHYHIRGVGDWGSSVYKPVVSSENARLGNFNFKVVESPKANLENVERAPCAYVDLNRECSIMPASSTASSICNAPIDVSIEIRGYYECSKSHEEGGEEQIVRRIQISY